MKKNYKYIVFFVFILYFTLNLVIIANNAKSDLPLIDLMPSESYLHEHMKNHEKHFALGPMLMVNFIKPLNYAHPETYDKIDSFIKDAQKINGITEFTLSWLLSTKKNQKVQMDNELCATENECFFNGLAQTRGEDTYFDDVNLVENNRSFIEISSSRMYLQMSKYTGSYDEVETWDNLQALAEEKYNFTKNDLFFFSSVYIFIEQLREIFPSVLSIFILSVECMFFGALVLVFDLKSIFIQLMIGSSLIVSIFSNLSLFGVSLNIATLFQLIMLPAFLFEFLFYTLYLFLYQTNSIESNHQFISENLHLITITNQIEETKAKKDIFHGTTSQNLSNCSAETSSGISQVTPNSLITHDVNEELEKIVAFKPDWKETMKKNNIKFLMNESTDISFIYLIIMFLFCLSLIKNCHTYNFHSLFLILAITCFNILVHLYFFYPNLLLLIGTVWRTSKVRVRC